MRLVCVIALSLLTLTGFSQTREIDSLKRILPTVTTDSTRIKVLRALCLSYSSIDPVKGIVYGKQALKIAQERGTDFQLSKAYTSLGIGYSMASHYDSAKAMLWQAVHYAYRSKNNRQITLAYLNLGIAYDYIANYDSALIIYTKGLKIAEEFNIATQQDFYGSIANVYRSIKNDRKALQYDSLALAKAKFFNDPEDRIILMKSNMAITLMNIGKPAEARALLLECVAFHEKTKMAYYLANEYRTLARLEEQQKRLDNARSYYLKSFRLNEEGNQRYDLAAGYLSLSNLEFYERNISLAKEYALKSYEISEKGSFINIRADASAQLSKIALYQNDLRLHSYYDSIGNYLSDSLRLSEQQKAIADINTKYETDKKEQENELLRQKQLHQEASILIQRYTIGAITVVILALAIVLFFVYRSQQLTKRTAKVLAKQREEIIGKNALLEQQKHEIALRNQSLEEKTIQIRESINYAKHIQDSILPSEEEISRLLPQSFVLHFPKDIIAGDFYWTHSIKPGCLLIAAGDCTGHGVPGAIVSVICINILNQIVGDYKIENPGDILDKARQMVDDYFTHSENQFGDGMDVSLALLNTDTRELRWAGANNPIWIIRNGQAVVEQILPDKQTVGYNHTFKSFTTHTVQLAEHDCFYLMTDGLADQFGGPHEKKIMQKGVKELLMTVHTYPMQQQGELFKRFVLSWRGNLDQTDDICVVGIRV